MGYWASLCLGLLLEASSSFNKTRKKRSQSNVGVSHKFFFSWKFSYNGKTAEKRRKWKKGVFGPITLSRTILVKSHYFEKNFFVWFNLSEIPSIEIISHGFSASDQWYDANAISNSYFFVFLHVHIRPVR